MSYSLRMDNTGVFSLWRNLGDNDKMQNTLPSSKGDLSCEHSVKLESEYNLDDKGVLLFG